MWTTMGRLGWLTYWGVYARFDFACIMIKRYVAWLSLWPYAKMAAIVWLQVADFADTVTTLECDKPKLIN